MADKTHPPQPEVTHSFEVVETYPLDTSPKPEPPVVEASPASTGAA